MKIGDKLYCKKSFIITSKNSWVTKGKIYELLYNHNNKTWYIIDDQKEINITILMEVNNYFHNKKEIRKIKIEKLNETRR